MSTDRTARKRPGRGALVIIALMLAGSGLARISAGAGQAQAENAAPVPELPVPQICEGGAGSMALVEALRQREESAAAREAELDAREKTLDLARAEIDKRLADLRKAEDELASTLTMADKAAEADISRLVTMYEGMKPKDAAPLFATMEPAFAANFLARMRPDSAAAILSALEPQTAYAISVNLAGRNADVPKF